MTPLSTEEITEKMQQFPDWEYAENAIHTTIEFKDFKDCFSLMTRIAFEAERLEHHPDWSNVYNRLNISLTTHDAGGVTSNDFDLAAIIDALVS